VDLDSTPHYANKKKYHKMKQKIKSLNNVGISSPRSNGCDEFFEQNQALFAICFLLVSCYYSTMNMEAI
jgi:hypothetical protein